MAEQTVNQQAKVSDSEYGWVAGFFDGEGSIMITLWQPSSKRALKVYPRCSVEATDIESFVKLHDILTRAGVGHHVQESKGRSFRANGEAYKNRWAILIYGMKRVWRFLIWITPALATKKCRAELMLDYIRSRQTKVPISILTQQEWLMIQRMRELNNGRHPRKIDLSNALKERISQG